MEFSWAMDNERQGEKSRSPTITFTLDIVAGREKLLLRSFVRVSNGSCLCPKPVVLGSRDVDNSSDFNGGFVTV
jgi:hypothetical protein